jgi:Domain of unknown function (DUF4337)
VSSPSKQLEEANERHEHARSGDWLVPLTSAIIAVLAALGSLFAHHMSIQALSIKNQALHETIKASDQYAYYQAKRMRIGMYNALLTADVVRDDKGRTNLKAAINHEETSSLAVLGDAKALEAEASHQQDRAETELSSFATFEIATTLFEISIVLASISALTRTRALLWTGTGLSTVGVAMMILAFAQSH